MRTVQQIDQDILQYIRPVTLSGGGTKFGVIVKKAGTTHTLLVDLGDKPDLAGLTIKGAKLEKLTSSDIKNLYFVEFVEESSKLEDYDMLATPGQASGEVLLIGQVGEKTVAIGFFSLIKQCYKPKKTLFYTTKGSSKWDECDSINIEGTTDKGYFTLQTIGFDAQGKCLGFLKNDSFQMPKKVESGNHAETNAETIDLTVFLKDLDKLVIDAAEGIKIGDDSDIHTWDKILHSFPVFLRNDNSLMSEIFKHIYRQGLYSTKNESKTKSVLLSYCVLLNTLIGLDANKATKCGQIHVNAVLGKLGFSALKHYELNKSISHRELGSLITGSKDFIAGVFFLLLFKYGKVTDDDSIYSHASLTEDLKLMIADDDVLSYYSLLADATILEAIRENLDNKQQLIAYFEVLKDKYIVGNLAALECDISENINNYCQHKDYDKRIVFHVRVIKNILNKYNFDSAGTPMIRKAVLPQP